jgi:hypothetical protein
LDRAQRCQAAFFAGALRWQAEDRPGAAEKFRLAVETGMTFAPEFHFAKAWLPEVAP